MAFRKPSKRAQQNWKELKDDPRIRAVRWAARYLSHRKRLWRKIGTGVLTVGHGLRNRRRPGSRSREFIDETVLVVTVAKKLSRAATRKARASRLVPPAIELRVPIDGRRILLAIPTDVQARPRTPVAQAQKQGIRAHPQSTGKKVKGTACVLVKNKNGEGPLYVLGCHHVVLRSLVMPGVSPDPFARIFSIPDGDVAVLMGVPTRAAAFGPGVIGSIDAALVRLNADGKAIATKARYWSETPLEWARDLEQIRVLARNGLTLWARGAKRVDLQYVEHVFFQPVSYPGGKVVIAEVLRCVADRARQAPPVGGDSGSPVFGPGRVLVGMHIAGDPPRRESFIIPSYQLIDGPAFHPRVVLAS